MKIVLVRITTLTLLVALLGGAAGLTGPAARASQALVDPALSAASGLVSVIVTAADSAAAARAVTRLGGQVTSDLWLIDAVAARLPASQLPALAAAPGVRSIAANNAVKTADDWTGWVTEKRVVKGTYTLPEIVHSPAAYLPDGGFVVAGEKGTILIINADGTERARLQLLAPPYKTPTIVFANGLIYIASETKHIHAISPNGSVLWKYSDANGAKFLGGVTAGPDGTVYAVDDRRTVYALDGLTGARRWVFPVSGSGVVQTSLAVSPDGTLYFVTDKGQVFAINPDGTGRWSYSTLQSVRLSPLAGANGLVYVTATEAKRVFALDAATGAVRFIFTAPSKIIAQPALGLDGSLYVAAEDRSLYGLNPDGAQRFAFRAPSSKFNTSPVLSPDGATVYAAVEDKTVFAVNTADGTERWRYTMLGAIKASPVVDSRGGLIVGSDGKDLVRLNPSGAVTFSTLVRDAIQQSAAASGLGDATVRIGSASLMTISPLPDRWDGRPDVLPTDSKKVWKLVYPLAVDIGADGLHSQLIDGTGVTIAVVDSGVYFDYTVKQELGSQVQKLFAGQADFIQPVCQTTAKYTLGQQFADFCLTDFNNSRDVYGHGTAVAGIMWNNFRDHATNTSLGIAPDARVFSVRVLDDNGAGSYETVIKGIQHVVANKAAYNIRVMNLSLSAYATVPYFVDPLNRAVEQAWASGIVVVAAAGNTGGAAETVTVPGSDPYVITVGSVNGSRTAGFWSDDSLPAWSSAGPTLDGFAKPDVLAPGSNIVTFMHNDPAGVNTQRIVQLHPDYSATTSLFRMNGTSMSAAVASAVVALMLEANPGLTPDQVKYRLMASAIPSFAGENDPTYTIFQQGAGRIWAPDAVLGSFPADGNGNLGLDLAADLAHGYETDEDLAFHYQGTIVKMLSDDGQYYIYYVDDVDGTRVTLGVARVSDMAWLDAGTLPEGAAWDSGRMTWAGGRMSWAGGRMSWAGGRMSWAGGRMSWAGGRMSWAGGRMSWAGGRMSWAGGRMSWAGGRMSWAGGRMSWAGMTESYASGRMSWAGSLNPQNPTGATSWVGDW